MGISETARAFFTRRMISLRLVPFFSERSDARWMVKPSAFGPDCRPQWPARGVHPGHIPVNAPLACGIAPPDAYWWEHWSYATPEQRKAKWQQYRQVADQLTLAERAHADSIMDG